MHEPSDAEHAAAIRDAVTAVNHALRAAHGAGLHVDLSVSHLAFGQLPPMPQITIAVIGRPL